MQATADRRASRRAASAPERRCIASGQVRPKEELLRFVIGPDGSLVPDPAARLPGRGLWLSARRDVLERACARNLFAKAAKAEIRLPPDLPAQTERVLRRRCLDLVGLARRAGQTAAGFEQVRDRLAAGGAALLIQARDAADGGRRKVAALAKATHPAMPIVAPFSAEELGRALGRGPTVHLLLLPGTLAERLKIELARLAAIAEAAGDDRRKID